MNGMNFSIPAICLSLPLVFLNHSLKAVFCPLPQGIGKLDRKKHSLSTPLNLVLVHSCEMAYFEIVLRTKQAKKKNSVDSYMILL